MIDFYPWVVLRENVYVFMIPEAYDEVKTALDFMFPNANMLIHSKCKIKVNIHMDEGIYDLIYCGKNSFPQNYMNITGCELIEDHVIKLSEYDRNKIGFRYNITVDYKNELISKRSDEIYDFDWFNKFTEIETPVSSIIRKYFNCFVVIETKKNTIEVPNINIRFNLSDSYCFNYYFNDLERLEQEIQQKYYL